MSYNNYYYNYIIFFIDYEACGYNYKESGIHLSENPEGRCFSQSLSKVVSDSAYVVAKCVIPCKTKIVVVKTNRSIIRLERILRGFHDILNNCEK